MTSLTAEAAVVDDVPEGTSVMAILDRSGDTKITWDRSNPAEVDAARRTFNDLTKKGHQAFAVRRGGEKGELIRQFDPDAEKIILSPPMVGG